MIRERRPEDDDAIRRLNDAAFGGIYESQLVADLRADGLRLVMAERGKAVKGKRILPPISRATGGPMPGVDIADLSALQEMDDLDHVERMQRFK